MRKREEKTFVTVSTSCFTIASNNCSNNLEGRDERGKKRKKSKGFHKNKKKQKHKNKKQNLFGLFFLGALDRRGEPGGRELPDFLLAIPAAPAPPVEVRVIEAPKLLVVIVGCEKQNIFFPLSYPFPSLPSPSLPLSSSATFHHRK